MNANAYEISLYISSFIINMKECTEKVFLTFWCLWLGPCLRLLENRLAPERLSYQGLTLLSEKPADRTNPAQRNIMSNDTTWHLEHMGRETVKYIYIYILKVHFLKFQSDILGLRVCGWKCTQVSLNLFLRLLACDHNWPTLPVMWMLAWFVCLLSLSCSTNTKKVQNFF